MTENNTSQLTALRGTVKEVFGSIEKFACQFGITPTQMGNKLNGKCGWTLADIRKAADILGIRDNASECHRIFFKE